MLIGQTFMLRGKDLNPHGQKRPRHWTRFGDKKQAVSVHRIFLASAYFSAQKEERKFAPLFILTLCINPIHHFACQIERACHNQQRTLLFGFALRQLQRRG